MRVRFLVLPACFIILAAVGFDGSSLTISTDVPVPQINSKKDTCVSSAIQTDAAPIWLQTNNMDALQLVGFVPTAIPVCVLSGDAGKEETRKFEECMAEKECDNWTKYEDEDDGTIAMICHGDQP